MKFEITDNRKKNKIKLSVIMSVYNGDSTLKESIKSILNQSFKNFEFIIINDGSTNFTHRVIEKFLKVKKNNILYIRSKKNLGLPKMLNTGIKYSNGAYIARQDADDISFRNRMFLQINFLKKNKKIDVLGCNSLNFNTNTSIKKKTDFPSFDFQIKREMLKINPICHASVMFRANFFNKYGLYDEKFKKAQDYELWLRVKKKCKFHNLKDILLKRTIQKKSFGIITLYYGILSRIKNADGVNENFKSLLYSCRDILLYILNKFRFSDY